MMRILRLMLAMLFLPAFAAGAVAGARPDIEIAPRLLSNPLSRAGALAAEPSAPSLALVDLLAQDHLLPNFGAGQFSAFGGDDLLPDMSAGTPYTALAGDPAMFGATLTLADDLRLRMDGTSLDAPGIVNLDPLAGQSALGQAPVRSSVASIDWNFAPWGGFGLAASRLSVAPGLLDPFDAASLTGPSSVSTIGASVRVGFGDGWVTTFSYSEGITQLSLRANVSASAPDTLHSRTYGFSVAKRGLFGSDDSLGLVLSRPFELGGGEGVYAADASPGAFANPFPSLTAVTPETDVEFGYVTTFMDGALALQANAGYQMNVAGMTGTNAVSVISRAKINF
jgi:hypothetical protein